MKKKLKQKIKKIKHEKPKLMKMIKDHQGETKGGGGGREEK